MIPFPFSEKRAASECEPCPPGVADTRDVATSTARPAPALAETPRHPHDYTRASRTRRRPGVTSTKRSAPHAAAGAFTARSPTWVRRRLGIRACRSHETTVRPGAVNLFPDWGSDRLIDHRPPSGALVRSKSS
jgi:hypothetical protein